eukprot:jgi/Chrzof1/4404/Cz14g11250.t1
MSVYDQGTITYYGRNLHATQVKRSVKPAQPWIQFSYIGSDWAYHSLQSCLLVLQEAREELKEHHYAAPEVEDRKPHPYEMEGIHRRESLTGELPEERMASGAQASEVGVQPSQDK